MRALGSVLIFILLSFIEAYPQHYLMPEISTGSLYPNIYGHSNYSIGYYAIRFNYLVTFFDGRFDVGPSIGVFYSTINNERLKTTESADNNGFFYGIRVHLYPFASKNSAAGLNPYVGLKAGKQNNTISNIGMMLIGGDPSFKHLGNDYIFETSAGVMLLPEKKFSLDFELLYQFRRPVLIYEVYNSSYIKTRYEYKVNLSSFLLNIGFRFRV